MEKPPYIGQLEYPIKVQREVKTVSLTGEERVSSYETIANLKAQLNRQSGNDEVDGKLRNLIVLYSKV